MAKIRKSKQTVFQEIFWTAVAGILVFLPKVLLPASESDELMTRKYATSVQGKERCPDSSSAGPSNVVTARSYLDCARKCVSRQGCLHHAFHKNNGNCHLYFSTPASVSCSFMVNVESYEGCFPEATKRIDPNGCSLPFLYDSKEYNEYITVTQNSTPQCVSSSGQLTDCIAPVGFSVKQHVVNLPVGASVPLPCVSNWIILMQRYQKSADFRRNWTEYKNGFGDFAGAYFWTGNEKMHTITNEPGVTYRLRVEVQAYLSGYWYYAEYATFHIDSEDKWYAIHLTGYSSDAGDSLTNTTEGPWYNHNGMNFTTYDADNDMNPDGSCAIKTNGSWWFNNCFYSCLTSDYGTKRLSWFTLDTYGLQYLGRIKAARMMISSI